MSDAFSLSLAATLALMQRVSPESRGLANLDHDADRWLLSPRVPGKGQPFSNVRCFPDKAWGRSVLPRAAPHGRLSATRGCTCARARGARKQARLKRNQTPVSLGFSFPLMAAPGESIALGDGTLAPQQ